MAMRRLLEASVDKDKANNAGRTPWYIAAQDSDVNIVQLLLNAGADKEKANKTMERHLFLLLRSVVVQILCNACWRPRLTRTGPITALFKKRMREHDSGTSLQPLLSESFAETSTCSEMWQNCGGCCNRPRVLHSSSRVLPHVWHCSTTRLAMTPGRCFCVPCRSVCST